MMDFAVVAHDLRAPLHVMLVHLRLLTSEPLSANGRTRLGFLESQVRRMMRCSTAAPPRRMTRLSRSQVDIA